MVGEALGENFVNLKKCAAKRKTFKQSIAMLASSISLLCQDIFFNVVLQAIQFKYSYPAGAAEIENICCFNQ